MEEARQCDFRNIRKKLRSEAKFDKPRKSCYVYCRSKPLNWSCETGKDMMKNFANVNIQPVHSGSTGVRGFFNEH